MNKIFTILFFVFFFSYSCIEPFTPDIETSFNVLVVEGLITDSVGTNYVKLSSTVPFDSTSSWNPQQNATVYVTDNYDNVYYFEEKSSGIYEPQDADFTGNPGNAYTLNVITKDGYNYQSTPQIILPDVLPNKFYSRTVSKDELIHGQKVIRDWYSLRLNFKSIDNTVLRFRFVNGNCIQYFYNGCYCWYTENSRNTLNFTDEKYPVSLSRINDYPVEEFYRDNKINVNVIGNQPIDYSDAVISNRILRINQYRINEETYAYYQGIASQSANEGRIFDPVSAQLYGNMKCITDSGRLVLGFFEASSISTYSYSIDCTYYLTKQIPNIYPPNSSGYTIDEAPDFWIY